MGWLFSAALFCSKFFRQGEIEIEMPLTCAFLLAALNQLLICILPDQLVQFIAPGLAEANQGLVLQGEQYRQRCSRHSFGSLALNINAIQLSRVFSARR